MQYEHPLSMQILSLRADRCKTTVVKDSDI